MDHINWIETEAAAKALVGNWQHFECFYLGDSEIDEGWTIQYTHNRDSDLLTESNAAAIEKEMAPFLEDGTAKVYRASHWACGWIEGFAIVVYDENGETTEAFCKWCEIQYRLEQYPVLNEEDWSQREVDATVENIKYELHSYELEGDLGEIAYEVYSWLYDNDQGEVDPCGYPSDEAVEAALVALGLLEVEND